MTLAPTQDTNQHHRRNGTRLLLDTPPLMLQRELACALGIEAALILQQLHYWTKENEKHGRNQLDGHTWVWNTLDGWHAEFPFISKRTLERRIAELEAGDRPLLITTQPGTFDRTKWYRISYEALDERLETLPDEALDPASEAVSHPASVAGSIRKRDYTETKNLHPTGAAKTLFLGEAPTTARSKNLEARAKGKTQAQALARRHLRDLEPLFTSGASFDLLHEFGRIWRRAWQETLDAGGNPKAVGIQLLGHFIATVTGREPDWGRAGMLVGRFGKLALLGIDEGLMANADDPYRYAFAVCKARAAAHRMEGQA